MKSSPTQASPGGSAVLSSEISPACTLSSRTSLPLQLPPPERLTCANPPADTACRAHSVAATRSRGRRKAEDRDSDAAGARSRHLALAAAPAGGRGGVAAARADKAERDLRDETVALAKVQAVQDWSRRRVVCTHHALCRPIAPLPRGACVRAHTRTEQGRLFGAPPGVVTIVIDRGRTRRRRTRARTRRHEGQGRA